MSFWYEVQWSQLEDDLCGSLQMFTAGQEMINEKQEENLVQQDLVS